MHEIYLNGIRFPVTPGQLETKIQNKNKTITLIDDGEINLLKRPGLTDIEFEVLLPNQEYVFAVYPEGYMPASEYIAALGEIKSPSEGEATPVPFTVSRFDAGGKYLFGTSILVSVEDYALREASEQGTDIIVKIKLKQYRTYGTKTYILSPAEADSESKMIDSSRVHSTAELTVGCYVKINKGAKYYNGQVVPDWVYLNTYIVSAVGVAGKEDCVLLDKTGLNSLIAAADLTVLKGAVATVP